MTRIWNEVFFYVVVFGGYFQGFIVLVFAGVSLFALPTRFRDRVVRRFLQFFSFNVCLLLFGAVACALWAAVAWQRWYVEADPVVTYQPLFPFGQHILDSTFGTYRGGLRNGASLAQLQVLWWTLTVFVWSASIWLHRRVIRIVDSLLGRSVPAPS